MSYGDIKKHRRRPSSITKRAITASSVGAVTAGFVYSDARRTGSSTAVSDAAFVGTGAAAATFVAPFVLKATLVAFPVTILCFGVTGLVKRTFSFINDVIHLRDDAYWDREWENYRKRIAANEFMRKVKQQRAS